MFTKDTEKAKLPHIAFWQTVSAAIVAGAILSPASAAVLNVPSVSYPDLSAAFAVAVDGDRIILGNGVHSGAGNNNLDFAGRAISLRSSSGDPTTCIIDCGGVAQSLFLTTPASSRPVIDGITFQNGFEGLTAGGGLVYIDGGSSPIFRDCVFRDTLLPASTQGGAVLIRGASTPRFKDCLFQDNGSELGGALSAVESSTVNLIACEFLSNSSRGNGGAINSRDSVLVLQQNILDENDARYRGGAVYGWGTSSIEMISTSFEENSAGYSGGAIHCRDDASLNVHSSSRLSNNSADRNGGGVSVETTSTCTFDDTVFEFNTAILNGGGLIARSSNVTFNACYWNSNHADQVGGAFSIESASTASIVDDVLVGNSAEFGGGGNAADSRIEYTNVELTQNGAVQLGGAMRHLRADATIEACEFVGNLAQISGGGMMNVECDPMVTTSEFIGNLAFDLAGTGNGGAISNFEANPKITNCTFEINRASYEGGAILNQYSSPQITDCQFNGNDADNVGGGAIANLHSSPNILRCEFYDNAIDPSGGAILNLASSPTITWSRFERNTSTQNGGAIFSTQFEDTACRPVIEHCWFIENVATDTGGAICGGDDVHHTVTNSMFSRNTVTLGTGGAISHYSVFEPLEVVNCSFSRNQTMDYGGAVFAYEGSVVLLFNSIFYENTAGASASTELEQVDWYSGTTQPVMEYCDVEGLSSIVGIGLFDALPQFLNPATDDLHLLATSPCIDRSDYARIPAHIVNDLDVLDRFYDDPSAPNLGVGPQWADLGAYEVQGASACLALEVTNLVAGDRATFTLTGGTPGVRAMTVHGFKSGETIIDHRGDYCATFKIKGVNASKIIGGVGRTFDATGEISFRIPIPTGSSGRAILFQSAEQSTCPDECVSNLVEATIG